VDGVASNGGCVCYQYRMLWRRSFALFLALLALAAPSASFAQSAGQDQYQDPLAGGNGGSSGGGGSTHGSTGSGSTGSGSTGSSGSSAPSTAPASTAAGTTSGTGTTSSPTASGAQANGQLPRTGFDVILTFELGLAMLLVGLVSHRLLVLRDRR
jgi:hypothetical protein